MELKFKLSPAEMPREPEIKKSAEILEQLRSLGTGWRTNGSRAAFLDSVLPLLRNVPPASRDTTFEPLVDKASVDYLRSPEWVVGRGTKLTLNYGWSKTDRVSSINIYIPLLNSTCIFLESMPPRQGGSSGTHRSEMWTFRCEHRDSGSDAFRDPPLSDADFRAVDFLPGLTEILEWRLKRLVSCRAAVSRRAFGLLDDHEAGKQVCLFNSKDKLDAALLGVLSGDREAEWEILELWREKEADDLRRVQERIREREERQERERRLAADAAERAASNSVFIANLGEAATLAEGESLEALSEAELMIASLTNGSQGVGYFQ